MFSARALREFAEAELRGEERENTLGRGLPERRLPVESVDAVNDKPLPLRVQLRTEHLPDQLDLRDHGYRAGEIARRAGAVLRDEPARGEKRDFLHHGLRPVRARLVRHADDLKRGVHVEEGARGHPLGALRLRHLRHAPRLVDRRIHALLVRLAEARVAGRLPGGRVDHRDSRRLVRCAFLRLRAVRGHGVGKRGKCAADLSLLLGGRHAAFVVAE